jgi:hypothetical protein
VDKLNLLPTLSNSSHFYLDKRLKWPQLATRVLPSTTTMTSVKRPRTPSQSSTSSNLSSPNASTYSLTSGYNHYPSHKYTRVVPNAGSMSPRSIDGTSTSSGSTIKLATTGTGNTNDTLPATRHPLLCTLPPTCHRHPTPIADTNDLERHYATYHAHVCGVKGCGCVFPDGRLLELVSGLSMGVYYHSSFFFFYSFFFFRVLCKDGVLFYLFI